MDFDSTRNRTSGAGILVGKDGPQLIRTTGQRWSEEAEDRFLDTLAASCNVSAAAEAAGFTRFTCYKHRRRDPGFAKRWDAALEQGAARIRALLLQRAIEALEGFAPDQDTPIPNMTVKEALAVLAAHDRRLSGGPRSRREWARPRSLDEMRDSILRKLEAIAPSPLPLLDRARDMLGGGDGGWPAEVSARPEPTDPPPIPPASEREKTDEV